jgi:hypothetical protein
VRHTTAGVIRILTIAIPRYARDFRKEQLGDPLFVPHIVHIDCWVALKFSQAINRTEIERFRMIIMAGSGVSNADFHFADGINRHGRPPVALIPQEQEMFPGEQLAIGKWQLAQLKPGPASSVMLNPRSLEGKKDFAANQREETRIRKRSKLSQLVSR